MDDTLTLIVGGETFALLQRNKQFVHEEDFRQKSNNRRC